MAVVARKAGVEEDAWRPTGKADPRGNLNCASASAFASDFGAFLPRIAATAALACSSYSLDSAWHSRPYFVGTIQPIDAVGSPLWLPSWEPHPS